MGRVACVVLALLLAETISAPSLARAEGPYDGYYTASPARITANVEKWGGDCGVRPKSYTLQERPEVPVTGQGKHLHLKFPSGPLTTDRCWSQNPALRQGAASGQPGRWHNQCATAEGESKSEHGRYEVVSKGPNTLQLTESSRYDWQLKTSHCVASVRITRTLTRVPEPGAEPPPPPPPPPEPEEKATADCVPGTLAKFWLSPSHARVEPGQRVCFKPRAADANGCRIPKPTVKWELKELGHGKATLQRGCFRSKGSAAEGEGRYRVSASTTGFVAKASVRVVTADLSDITAHNVLSGRAGGLAPPTAVDDVDSKDVPARAETKVAAKNVRTGGTQLPWALITAGLALLAAGGAWLARRSRAQVAAADEAAAAAAREDAEAASAAARARKAAEAEAAAAEAARAEAARAAAAQPPAPRPSTGEAMICPKCRRGYPPGASVCDGDGSKLMTYKDFSNQGSPQAGGSSCRSCGERLTSGTTFCGKCGAKVTPT